MSEFRFNDEIKVTSLKRYDNLRKEIELMNANVFNDKNIKPKECIDILINLIYLLNQGESFTDQEKERLFFDVTKLLHSSNNSLRRLIFLFVKHLNFWQNSFILTGSLISEINKSEENLLKPNCFRLLGQIIDISSVSVVERLLKVAISSQNSDVSSSAIICTLFMVFKGFNVAKSWISEISDKLNSSIGQENLLTFHTLLLLKQIKENDKLFLIKIYTKLADNQSIKSQFVKCQLIRYIDEIMQKEELENSTIKVFNTFLERCIYGSEDSIKIEACRAILNSKKIKQSLQKNAIGIICDLMVSSNRVIKYAALKTLDKHISNFSQTMAIDIFMEIEKIIEDNYINSSIKAIALSIFLKISKGLSDFRLEKMFKSFIEQYPTFKEDFKKEVVIISKGISRENTQKNKLYFNFFSSLFKLDAGSQTKLEILDALIWYIYNDKDLKTQCIFFLAEYISDCQYEVVKIRILNLLGKECQLASSPNKLVRHIVNQINLETPMVRASAIAALGEIGFKEKSQRDTIIKYISKSFNDSDNEVRERAYFYYKALNELNDENKAEEEKKISNYIFNNNNKNRKELNIDLIQNILKFEKENLLNSENISNELSSILNDPEKINDILIKNKMNEPKKEETGKKNKAKDTSSSNKDDSSIDAEYKKTTFSKVYGKPKIITPYMKLTDSTAEYLTKYRKIIHDKIVVLDFEITNTIELQVIQKISLEVEDLVSNGFNFNKTEIIEIDKLGTNENGHLYLKLLKDENEIYSSCNFHVILKFDLQELDVKGNPHGIAVKEQYKIDKLVDVSYADYFIKNNKVDLNNFSEIWKMAEKSNYKKLEEKMGLPYPNIKNAVKNVSSIIGFNPINDIDNIDPTIKKFEFVYAYVSYLDSLVFIKFQVVFNDANKCLAQIIILSQDENIPDLILNKIYA